MRADKDELLRPRLTLQSKNAAGLTIRRGFNRVVRAQVIRYCLSEY